MGVMGEGGIVLGEGGGARDNVHPSTGTGRMFTPRMCWARTRLGAGIWAAWLFAVASDYEGIHAGQNKEQPLASASDYDCSDAGPDNNIMFPVRGAG